MQIGMVGLGRMGGSITQRLLRSKHAVVAYDRDGKAVQQAAAFGASGCSSLEVLVRKLQAPRVVWVMLPAGEATEVVIQSLADLLESGDVVIDGGNSYWKDDIRRARALKERGLHYVDVGTSGGVWGLDRGYCLMIGGEETVVSRLDPLFRTLAPGNGGQRSGAKTPDERARHGYIHAGPHGAGHFVKMVHNGIEYGLMQAYAEGFDILKHAGSQSLPAGERLNLDLASIAEVWRHGSVITSWLLDLTAAALAEDQTLSEYSGYVQDSGEGRWTIMAAIDEAVPAEVLSAALYARFRSRQEHTFAEKVLSAMRKGFGGHLEAKPNGKTD